MTDDAESRCADGVVFGLSAHSNGGKQGRDGFNRVRKKLEAVVYERRFSLQREAGYKHGANKAGSCKFERVPQQGAAGSSDDDALDDDDA
jgi:hypothetical protein